MTRITTITEEEGNNLVRITQECEDGFLKTGILSYGDEEAIITVQQNGESYDFSVHPEDAMCDLMCEFGLT